MQVYSCLHYLLFKVPLYVQNHYFGPSGVYGFSDRIFIKKTNTVQVLYQITPKSVLLTFFACMCEKNVSELRQQCVKLTKFRP